MGKHVLMLDEEYDFSLIGFVCQWSDYKMAWTINKELDFKFIRVEDLDIKIKNEIYFFSTYKYYDALIKETYYLIENTSKKQYLIPELKQIKYFIAIKNSYSKSSEEKIISFLKKAEYILFYKNYDPNEYSSAEHIMYID